MNLSLLEIKNIDYSLLNKIDSDRFNYLNDSQLIAVTNIYGNFLVLAGAGTGKTQILILRTYLLLQLKIPDEKILLITFTRKAANEIKNRISKIYPNAHLTIETFHSFALKMIKKNFQNITFNIIDTSESLKILKSILKNYKLKNEHFTSAFSPEQLLLIFDRAKSLRLNISQVLNSSQIKYLDDILYIHNKFTLYKKICSYTEFDDIILLFLKFLKEGKISPKYEFIMIDEYQDTDLLQKEVLKILGLNSNVMAVGDDYQSIYAFRGAQPENIFTFPLDFKNTRTIFLKQNYRSTPEILNYVNNISKHFLKSSKKLLFSSNSSCHLPTVTIFKDAQSELLNIVKHIRFLLSKNISLRNISILFRDSYRMEPFIHEFLKYNIPIEIKADKYNRSSYSSTSSQALTLSTIHGAKGLEWEYVFIPLLLDKVFPPAQSDLEEERRLFYVACSRAKKYLFLSFPQKIYDSLGFFCDISPFVQEIDSNLFKIKREE